MPAKWTPETFKNTWLFGIPDKNPETGEPFPEESYQFHIDQAYAALERMLDIAILPKEILDERHDYYVQEYRSWGFLHVFKKPIRSVTAVRGMYPYYNSALQIPPEWIIPDKLGGQINLIPVAGTLNQFIFTATGGLLPQLFRHQSYVPHFWAVDYEAGFEENDIPYDLNEAVAKLACMSILNILGDLVGGVGVLGASIGMDGLSQYISMTKTATTGAFYSRVLQYKNEFFGPSPGAPGGELHSLKRKYRGILWRNM